MIRKRNPGSGTMYDFENVEELKTTVRSMLHDDMAEEANICFQFAMQLFEELESE
jgi:heme oxygenase